MLNEGRPLTLLHLIFSLSQYFREKRSQSRAKTPLAIAALIGFKPLFQTLVNGDDDGRYGNDRADDCGDHEHGDHDGYGRQLELPLEPPHSITPQSGGLPNPRPSHKTQDDH